jgi:hypothetical protein
MAAMAVLSVLPCRRDLARARGQGSNWGAESRGMTVQDLRGQLAKCLGQLRGVAGTEDSVEKLEISAMRLHSVSAISGAVSKGMFTRPELELMRDTLAAGLEAWHRAGKQQNVPEYRRMSDQFFIVQQKLKTQ